MFRPIEGDRLSLTVDQATYSKLPSLLSALQRQLSASPAKASFDPKAVERLATQVLDAGRSATQGCSCRRLVSGDDPVPRKALLEFAAEVDQYQRSGTANLQEHRLYSLGSTTWLGDAGGRSNAAVIRTLQAFGADPCILPEVLVRVPMPALLALRGPVPTDDAAQLPKDAPLCAGFSREAP